MKKKEMKKPIPMELDDKALDAVSGAYSGASCSRCGIMINSYAINSYMNSGMCSACLLEHLREQNPNLTEEELAKNNNTGSGTKNPNVLTTLPKIM